VKPKKAIVDFVHSKEKEPPPAEKIHRKLVFMECWETAESTSDKARSR
jgi:hypothetical protein